jgi:hypothetical protein
VTTEPPRIVLAYFREVHIAGRRRERAEKRGFGGRREGRGGRKVRRLSPPKNLCWPTFARYIAGEEGEGGEILEREGGEGKL